MEMDEAGTLAKLKSLRDGLIHPTIAKHRGRIVKLMGDGTLVEFISAVEAVRCAIALQEGVAAREADVPEDGRVAQGKPRVFVANLEGSGPREARIWASIGH